MPQLSAGMRPGRPATPTPPTECPDDIPNCIICRSKAFSTAESISEDAFVELGAPPFLPCGFLLSSSSHFFSFLHCVAGRGPLWSPRVLFVQQRANCNSTTRSMESRVCCARVWPLLSVSERVNVCCEPVRDLQVLVSDQIPAL